VLDDAGRVIAMITDRDICMAALMRDRAPSAIPVSEAMSRSLRSCQPDDAVATAEKTMRTYQIRRIPIVDKDGRLVGVLSLADIVRAAERKKGRAPKDVAPAEVAGTLADICATPTRERARATSRAS
jgi:signal-transduction protein with cAMP-binding, CBS, and nucleotidyltransferase domain